MICGMSRKTDGWDNAVAESFFHSLKTEWIKDSLYSTREQAGMAVVDSIEMFYSNKRLHSSINYRSPNDFEKRMCVA